MGNGDFDESSPVLNEGTVDHNCFGCGNLNPAGLRLRFRSLDGGRVWAAFTPTRAHEGHLGMTHGGILATMLVEAMSWAITATGDLGVTGRMTLSFRTPARINEPLRVIGRVTRRRDRMVDTSGEVRAVQSGLLVAEAEGRFVRVSNEQAASWREAYAMDSAGSPIADAEPCISRAGRD